MRALLVCVMSAGCVQWTAPEMQQHRLPLATPIVALRTDTLPGSGALLADGTFRYQVDLAHVCRRSELVKQRVITVENKVFSQPGKISIAPTNCSDIRRNDTSPESSTASVCWNRPTNSCPVRSSTRASNRSE